MHLKINDFKKAGWNTWDTWKYSTTKSILDEEDNLLYIMSVSTEGVEVDTFSIEIPNSKVGYIEIQIDNISTIEELEKTAKDLYLAIKGLE